MADDKSNRREALKKIGMALAAATAAGALPTEILGQKPKPEKVETNRALPAVLPGQFKIPERVQTAVHAGGEFDVFLARNGAEASALVLRSSDTQGINELRSSLKVSPAKASVVNGVIHVGLGSAGASRGSVAQRGAVDFRGATLTNNALFVR